jgi:hypothetical protein
VDGTAIGETTMKCRDAVRLLVQHALGAVDVPQGLGDVVFRTGVGLEAPVRQLVDPVLAEPAHLQGGHAAVKLRLEGPDEGVVVVVVALAVQVDAPAPGDLGGEVAGLGEILDVLGRLAADAEDESAENQGRE